MTLSNADKQKQNHGLVHVQGWVSPEQAELIKQIIAGASEASEGANEIIDEIKNIKERWGTVLEKHLDPVNGRISFCLFFLYALHIPPRLILLHNSVPCY